MTFASCRADPTRGPPLPNCPTPSPCAKGLPPKPDLEASSCAGLSPCEPLLQFRAFDVGPAAIWRGLLLEFDCEFSSIIVIALSPINSIGFQLHSPDSMTVTQFECDIQSIRSASRNHLNSINVGLGHYRGRASAVEQGAQRGALSARREAVHAWQRWELWGNLGVAGSMSDWPGMKQPSM